MPGKAKLFAGSIIRRKSRQKSTDSQSRIIDVNDNENGHIPDIQDIKCVHEDFGILSEAIINGSDLSAFAKQIRLLDFEVVEGKITNS